MNIFNKLAYKIRITRFNYKHRHLKNLQWDGGYNCLNADFTMSETAHAIIDGTAHICKVTSIQILDDAYFSMGHHCTTNRNVMIVCKERIIIGDNVLIGPNTVIIDNDHDYHRLGIERRDKYIKKPIIIGNNVWIGANCVILKGTKIGDNSVIAAGSVVSGEVSSNCIYHQKRIEIQNRIELESK